LPERHDYIKIIDCEGSFRDEKHQAVEKKQTKNQKGGQHFR
jgi:hypothetical protein